MAYVTVAEVKEFLGISSTVDDMVLAGLITVAQRAIEDYCGRVFEAPTDQSRFYACLPPTVEGRTLYLDHDLCQINGVVNGNGEVVEGESLQPEPPDPPYHALTLLSSGRTRWACGETPARSIRVTGRWAYALTAPPPVIQATKMVVSWLYRWYDRQAESWQVQVKVAHMPPPAADLLAPYRRLG
jgi:hypothetical protein